MDPSQVHVSEQLKNTRYLALTRVMKRQHTHVLVTSCVAAMHTIACGTAGMEYHVKKLV